MVLLDEDGVIDFSRDKMKDLVGGEKLTYDEYLDLQRKTGNNVRHSFQHCFYTVPLGFRGQIEKKSNHRVCFKRIFVEGMDEVGMCFDGKEDHVWMEEKGFSEYKVGDCVSFYAEVYRYVKTGNGKSIDFGLRNPEGIKKIGPYELPSDGELIRQEIEQIVCESCFLNEQCYGGMCLLPKGERKTKVNALVKA